MLKTIIFDFDGVVGDTFNINFQSCKDLFPSLTEQVFRDSHNGNIFKSEIKWTPQNLAIFYARQKQKFTKKHLFAIKKPLQKLQKNTNFL